MKKVTQTTEDFFKYAFRGDGVYHTTESGSRHYRKTTFQRFYDSNRDCIDIVGRGNDAPRGGRTGDWVDVRFNANFYTRWQWYIDALAEKKQRAKDAETERQTRIAALGDQAAALRVTLVERPDRLARLVTAIETRPSCSSRSGDWRSYVRMKAAKWVAGGEMRLLTLRAPQIRDIVYELKGS